VGQTFHFREGKEGFSGYIRDVSPCRYQSRMTLGKPLLAAILSIAGKHTKSLKKISTLYSQHLLLFCMKLVCTLFSPHLPFLHEAEKYAVFSGLAFFCMKLNNTLFSPHLLFFFFLHETEK
jgi:hypothetical protein